MQDQAEGLREMMRAGAEQGAVPELLTQPVQELSMQSMEIRSSPVTQTGLASKVSAGFVSRPKETKKTRIITVASGKGGVGKTNMSVNMALSYARLGKKVVVMDADLGLANVNVVLGITPKFNLYHVIRNQKLMRDILLETEYGISIVAGASGFSKIANLNDEERQRFISELNTLSNADIIIIDTSAGVSSNVLDFVAAADDVVIVTTPEPPAMTDAYGIIKIIATEIDNLEMGLSLIVNRVRNSAEGLQVANRMIEISSRFLNIKLEYLGCIYDDPQVGQAVKRQKPFTVLDPRCKAAQCVQHIVRRLEKTEVRDRGGFGNLFKRMFGG